MILQLESEISEAYSKIKEKSSILEKEIKDSEAVKKGNPNESLLKKKQELDEEKSTLHLLNS